MRVRRWIRSWRPAAVRARLRNRPWRTASASVRLRRRFSVPPYRWPFWLEVLGDMLFPRKTIYAYPQRPSENYMMGAICAMSRCRLCDDVAHPHDVMIKFHAATYSEPSMIWKGFPDARQAINGMCFDISKSYSETVFEQVFGYSLRVDPLVYDGQMIEKSNANGLRKICVVDGPLQPDAVREGYVYEKLVDTLLDDGSYYVEHRVPVINGCIPYVGLKHLLPEFRFKRAQRVEIVGPGTVFDAAEQASLLRMAETMFLDVGELDVLRDKHDGRIYVVDVNNTAWLPANAFVPATQRTILRLLQGPFEQLLERFSL